jgi:tRNA(Ile2) C34 agmatinyltransferase TiaS
MDPSIYALAVLVALAICALATIVSARPQRPCPRCDVRTALAARRCRSCGYEPA